MAQNFLYMFEFVVDDILITRPNLCAPEEYPTCVEINFRTSVFLSVCDREFGECPDPCKSKCGKCVLFSLDSEITEKDRLFIHVYKKKTERCKFLLGAADLPIKPVFDRVTENFNIENPDWEEGIKDQLSRVPDPRKKSSDCVEDCEDDKEARPEQMCPTTELTKRLLPLFNRKGVQTGNIVIIMRLVCNGPAIVSTFPFSKFCASTCKSKESCDICPPVPAPPTGPCVQPDPCKKKEKPERKCQRYFACNEDKLCPCDGCEDEFDRDFCSSSKNKKQKCNKKTSKKDECSPCRSCGGYCCPQKQKNCTDIIFNDNDINPCKCNEEVSEETADDCDVEEEDCAPQPCFIEPVRLDPGPEAYEVFEACLNGNGIKIRVLKDSHKVSDVDDGAKNQMQNSEDECDKCIKDETYRKCQRIEDLLQKTNFAKNHIGRRTKGHIINHPKLPKIRANLKYSGADECCPTNYKLPFDKIKEICAGPNKAELYRVKGGCDEECGAMYPAQERGACMQINPTDILNALSGINADTRKKGIEVCYKACEDFNSDVFLIKLGSKKKCENSKNAIEIELRTPKADVSGPKQKVTVETQNTGKEIDAALGGKKGKKGKGKK